MRGLPGSGKSTRARELAAAGPVLSADDYFERDGEYRFDRGQLAAAHRATLEQLERELDAERSPIVIDNTHSQAWEMRPYVEAGLARGYLIEFAFPTSPWAWNPAELARRNVHRVPEEAIALMRDRFQMSPSLDEILEAEPPSSAPA